MGGVKRVFAGRLCIHQLHHADEYNGSPWLNRKGFPMQIAAMFVNYYNSGERMPEIACGQTWLSRLLLMSTVPNTGRSLFNSSNRGLDEEDQ